MDEDLIFLNLLVKAIKLGEKLENTVSEFKGTPLFDIVWHMIPHPDDLVERIFDRIGKKKNYYLDPYHSAFIIPVKHRGRWALIKVDKKGWMIIDDEKKKKLFEDLLKSEGKSDPVLEVG